MTGPYMNSNRNHPVSIQTSGLCVNTFYHNSLKASEQFWVKVSKALNFENFFDHTYPLKKCLLLKIENNSS